MHWESHSHGPSYTDEEDQEDWNPEEIVKENGPDETESSVTKHDRITGTEEKRQFYYLSQVYHAMNQ